MASEKRLIDAITLISKARRMETTDNNGIPVDTFAVPVMVIEDATTVDAVEVVHGRWIDKTEWIGSFGQIKTECSVCGTIYPHKPGSRGDGKGGKFCEECGARMDGAE